MSTFWNTLLWIVVVAAILTLFLLGTTASTTRGVVTSWSYDNLNRTSQTVLVDTTCDGVPDLEAYASVTYNDTLIVEGDEVDIAIPAGCKIHPLLGQYLTGQPSVTLRRKRGRVVQP